MENFSIKEKLKSGLSQIRVSSIGLALFGSCILAFGLYNIHSVSGVGFSLFYGIFELFPRIWQIGTGPVDLVLAAVAGALFVGIGAGLCVRVGGAPSGDDALAMAISAKAKLSIQWAYLISDLIVLGLSLTYIPAVKLAYSLLTVVLSGQIIDIVNKVGRRKKSCEE